MSKPLLSIIIPTKNRYTVLLPTLKALRENINNSSLEFVIQDNSSNNGEILSYIEQANDSRIQYFYETRDLDVVTNFNRAIRNARGKYIILIGDDDLINPYIMNIIDIIDKSEINCLIYPRGTYYWPDVTFEKEFNFFEPSSIQVIKEPDLNICKLSSQIELEYVLLMGGIYLYNLPALYHGIVKKEIVDQIYKKHGTYVLGPSPDMSLAISLTFELKYYHYINFPVSIPGASYNSAAGMGRRGEHNASLENLPKWLPREIVSEWDPNIPKVWNGFTVYAQSIFMVFKYYSFFEKINYSRLYDKILRDNFNDIIFFKDLNHFKKLGFMKRNNIKLKNLLIYVLRETLKKMPRVALNIVIRYPKYFKNRKHIRNINSSESCMRWLASEYKILFPDIYTK